MEPESHRNRPDSDLKANMDAKRTAERTDDPIVNLIAGGLLGAVGGAGLGFSVSLAFTGWAVVAFFAGGVAGGVLGMALGYFRGDSFTEWLKENLWRFW
ncbi:MULTISPECIES: hypothetical protein [Rhodopirellula]|uniref:hypothetical protein n=1 Tax=Rhodopirellula TaxID=265488 RepID=UPI00257C3FEE|nr:hypothetical protein [Rhodopirellula sp. UBA1907]